MNKLQHGATLTMNTIKRSARKTMGEDFCKKPKLSGTITAGPEIKMGPDECKDIMQSIPIGNSLRYFKKCYNKILMFGH